MTPRSWDVGRSTAARAVVLAFVLAACGQARSAAPPEPEFVSGERAEPTVIDAADDSGSEGVEILPSDVEDDLAAIDVGQMVIVDDAGNASPNVSAWSAFDDALGDRLVGPNVSASVAVMIDGQLVHAAAYGERIAGGGDAVETSDRFRVASISKMITAIVTMQLVEDGVLPLDEPVGGVLSDHLGLSEVDSDVPPTTVRELLSHTAGFPKHQSTFFGNGSTSCYDAASQGLTGSVSGGSGYLYSNMSYCVLGVLIEAVTGKTYERVVYERLLTPLGISGMRMPSTYDLGPDEVSHHPGPGRNAMETLGAAGSWNATPSDLVRIINSIDHATPGWKAVSAETAETMRYRIVTEGPPSGYGLGIINYDADFGHTGTINNTHAMVLRQSDGITWAVTVSGQYPSESSNLRSIVRRALGSAFPGA